MCVQARAALTAREEALLADISNLRMSKEFVLTAQIDRLRTFEGCVQSAIQRATTALCIPNDAHVVSIKGDIEATLKALTNHPLRLQPQTNASVYFEMDVIKLLELIGTLGLVKDHEAPEEGEPSEVSCASSYALFDYETHGCGRS